MAKLTASRNVTEHAVLVNGTMGPVADSDDNMGTGMKFAANLTAVYDQRPPKTRIDEPYLRYEPNELTHIAEPPIEGPGKLVIRPVSAPRNTSESLSAPLVRNATYPELENALRIVEAAIGVGRA